MPFELGATQLDGGVGGHHGSNSLRQPARGRRYALNVLGILVWVFILDALFSGVL